MRPELNWVLAGVVFAGACGRETQKNSDASPSPQTEVCRAATETEIRALFDRWNDSLLTGDPQKADPPIKARYTYTYKWEGTRWLITSHHSSAMPEMR